MLLNIFIIKISIIVYLVGFCFNFGIAFAYLQRSRLEYNKTKKLPPVKNDYLRALTTSLPSIFGTLGILKVSHFPRYGWKITSGESWHSDWLYEYNKRLLLNDGAYKSIWGDS